MSPVVPGRPLRTADPLTSQPLRRHSHRPVRCARAFRSLTFPNSPRLRLRLGWLLILIVGSLTSRPTTSRAVPFASSLTNLGGFLSFRLNEPADRVLVVSNSGTQTNDVGSLGGGLQHLSLNVTGQYQILVLNSGPVGFISPVGPSQGARLQVSGDTVRTRFNNPRGIAINTNPRSPYFGRIYVANSSAGAATNLAFGPARNCGDGLYVLNADLSDAVGQGNTALTGGLEFMTNSDLSPYRLSLDAEDRLYICDQSDFSGGVYTVDGDVSARSGTNVLAAPSSGVFPVGPGRNHGSIAAAVPEGTVSSTNLALFVLDEALQVDRNSSVRTMLNSLWRHDLGGALPGPPSQPALVLSAPWFRNAGQVMDLSRGPNAHFYVNDYRANGADRAGLYVLSPGGALMWDSLEETRRLSGDPNGTDWLGGTGGGAVSPDGRFVAVINLDSNAITVLPISFNLPSLAGRVAFEGFEGAGGQGRDLAFDLAGNLYALSSGAQSLRVFSPGGVTAATTGSEGSFHIRRPSAISVRATDGLATEGGPDTATFTFHREGDTNSPLLVSFQLTGSALNGVDYQTNGGTLLFRAGQANLDLVLSPLDDTLSEPVESVTLTLISSELYDLDVPSSATVQIADADGAVVQITALRSSAYERLPLDTLLFAVDRLGETNSALVVGCRMDGGTAVPGVDFRGLGGSPLPESILLAPGQVRALLELEPINDREFEENESVVLQLLPGAGYAVSTQGLATAWIVDDELSTPALRSVLFSDDFERGTQDKWQIRFGANNGLPDYRAQFNFDYRRLGIPASPHSAPGSSLGLFLQVNKDDPTPGGAAGINLYPKNTLFTGNFALRFDLFVNMGPAAPTEHALAGINHSGLLTNRVSQSIDPEGTARGGDGIWMALSSNGSEHQHCSLFTVPFPGSAPVMLTNHAAQELVSILPAPPFSVAGAPGNEATNTRTWVEVELAQINQQVILKINNRVVDVLTNTTRFTNGTVMIGLNDQFDSVGSEGFTGNFVLFDNVQVLSYELAIRSINRTFIGTFIEFLSPAGGGAGDFVVESTTALGSVPWARATGSTVVAIRGGFQASVPRSDQGTFFRVRRNVGP